MTARNYHLAQINIARMVASYEDERMRDFVTQLERINRLAEESPGFLWRLQTEPGDASDMRVFGDPLLLVNMSVWESLPALKNYVYESAHRDLLRDRQRWFGRLGRAHLALWWIPGECEPTLEDAKYRLHLIDTQGPGPEAFTFRHAYPPPADAPGPQEGRLSLVR